jgi:adenylate cyclase
MPDLIARGKDGQNWKHPLCSGTIHLGRVPEMCDWAVPWDTSISRCHASLCWGDGHLTVCVAATARNPVVFKKKLFEAGQEFTLPIGERFAIGDTTFTLVASEDVPLPFSAATIGARELEEISFNSDADRIELLSDLPLQIRRSLQGEQIEAAALKTLLRGIREADVTALVRAPYSGEGEGEVVRIQQRIATATDFRPSWRLINEAVRRRRQPVIHVWSAHASAIGPSPFTEPTQYNWAMCVPLPDEPEPLCAAYLTGKLPPAILASNDPAQNKQLLGDAKFAKLVADILGALKDVSHLKQRQLHLNRLLSPPVRAALMQPKAEEALRAREADITVLFCDLRGSCGIAEQLPDKLDALWARVSSALAIMTGGIVDREGVIGDFQGDAAMGFWGWPEPHDDQTCRAAQAALDIQRDFDRQARPDTTLAGFRVGIGIGHGKAFAGLLGTEDQTKVSIYGPVVNLAARLESLTKLFGVPILIDEATANCLKSRQSGVRMRPLARIRPFGFTRALLVYELLPPVHQNGSLPESVRLDYEAAFSHFESGDWTAADVLLKTLEDDEPSQLLRRYIERHRFSPPKNWATEPVMVMEGK